MCIFCPDYAAEDWQQSVC